MPKKFAKMEWSKPNKELLAFLAGPKGPNTQWCGDSPKSTYSYLEKGSPQMTSKALPSWTDNYRLGDYVDSHNLPGEGNNVMYWPDEYDRIVADKLNAQGLCSMTKVQREVGDVVHATCQYHILRYCVFGLTVVRRCIHDRRRNVKV